MINNLQELNELAISYDLPFEDVLFINLNRQGIITDLNYERIRFYFSPLNNSYFEKSIKQRINKYFFAVPTHSGFSSFYLRGNRLFFKKEEIGKVHNIHNDTCDSIYPRRNGTVFNLNTQSKSLCRGCAFCHTFKQSANDIINLTLKEFIREQIIKWLKKYKISNLSNLFRVDIVTGCFGNEEKALAHLFFVRKIFSKFGFNGEIFYYGSEITSKVAFDELETIKPFAFCLSLECFKNRNKLLKKQKGIISLENAKRILEMSKKRKFGTQFSYILGLEPLDFMIEKMKEFLPYINRLPVINIFQPHTPHQKKMLDSNALRLEYFLNARKRLEKIFRNKNYKPRTWGNYRCLWYLKFGKEQLLGSRLP